VRHQRWDGDLGSREAAKNDQCEHRERQEFLRAVAPQNLMVSRAPVLRTAASRKRFAFSPALALRAVAPQNL